MPHLTKTLSLNCSSSINLKFFKDSGINLRWKIFLRGKNSFVYQFQISEVKFDEICIDSVTLISVSGDILNEKELSFDKPTYISVLDNNDYVLQICWNQKFDKLDDNSDELAAEQNTTAKSSQVDIMDKTSHTVIQKIIANQRLFESCSPHIQTVLKTSVEFMTSFSENTIHHAIEFCSGNSKEIMNFNEELLKFAEIFEIQSLKESCIDYFEAQTLNLDSVFDVLRVAIQYSNLSLKEKCISFIKANKSHIDQQKLGALPPDSLALVIVALI